jgi:hypothetical protein
MALSSGGRRVMLRSGARSARGARRAGGFLGSYAWRGPPLSSRST